MAIHPLLLLMLAQRLLELAYARGNTRRLRMRGAVETGAGHYPLLVALHAGWWLALAATVPPDRPPHLPPVAGLAVLMLARVWILASLGPFWTTRILTLPGAPLVRRGPYALLRHPNYWVVAGEVALVPLALDAAALAVTFSTANGALLAWRIAQEDRALAPRRAPPVNVRGNSAEAG